VVTHPELAARGRGFTEQCTQRAEELYERFVDLVVRTRGTGEAETAKLLENTYRHINIALVNEMARFHHELDIDLWNVIRCAAGKPFGSRAFYPGLGVEINAGMPAYIARRVQNLLNEAGKATRDAAVLLLGVTYKPDITDLRGSPALPLARQVKMPGAKVSCHDRHVMTWGVSGIAVDRVDELETAVAEADLVILVQNHRGYDANGLARRAQLFFDTRGVTSGAVSQRL
jgi:UDP-N-acetyl-D-glucosamine dehydrogenase